MLQGVAQVAGSVLQHVTRHGAEHALHQGQGRRVVGVVLVGQACGDGLHQQVRLVLGVAAGRGAQAHQGGEAAPFVDGVLYVAGVAVVLQVFCVDLLLGATTQGVVVVAAVAVSPRYKTDY